MASKIQTFAPSYGNGISITGAATTANAEIDSNRTRSALTVTNTGSDLVYVRTGDSTVVATSADYPVLGGTQVSLSKFEDHSHIAVIAPSGSPVVKAMSGLGI